MKNYYSEIIKHYGEEHQVLLAVEEMQELSKELLKNSNRKIKNVHDIKQELADVMVMLKQLMIIYEITEDELTDIMAKKIFRTMERTCQIDDTSN